MAASGTLVILFARLPEAGRAKTRLAAGIGARDAVRLYEAFTRDLIELLQRCGSAWRVEVAGDPEPFAAHYGIPVELCRRQVEGDLGARMKAAFAHALEAEGHARCVLLGSDLPHLPAAALGQAAAALALGESDLVLGPARDGGYYLVAMARPLPVFEGIAWSTGAVLSETRRRAEQAGFRVGLLEEDFDIDNAADLAELRRRLEELPEAIATHTRRALESISLPVA